MQADNKSQEYIKEIDGQKLKISFVSALNSLKKKKDLIDSLNVFPVPDGDTGTNMYLTFLEGVKKIRSINSSRVDKITSLLSQGALMGARGNSGVILSQLLRGFAEINKGKKYMNAENLARALKKASEIAYHGVMKPVEGTILTVSRGAARGAEKALAETRDFIKVLEKVVDEAEKTLNKTPEKLPELKEAGVVDAGGKGYLIILEGMLQGLVRNDNVKTDIVTSEKKKSNKIKKDIKYTYDTQILVDLKSVDKNYDIDSVRDDLQNYGDSIIVVGSDNTLKIHIHSNHPGVVLEHTLKLGDLRDITIENMKLQNQEFIKRETQKEEVNQVKNLKDISENDVQNNLDNSEYASDSLSTDEEDRAIISVFQGEGLKEIFVELGINKVIDGGQSMNPSTNDFIEAMDDLNKKEIIIFPNNSNVISAAKQAASMSEKEVVVIPTNSIAENISALMVNDPQKTLSDLKKDMETEIEQVKTLKFTQAVKNSSVNDMDIKKGDILGLCEDEIQVKGKNLKEVVLKLLTRVREQEELITLYIGENLDKGEVKGIIEAIREKCDIDEIEDYYGGQVMYPLIISLE